MPPFKDLDLSGQVYVYIPTVYENDLTEVASLQTGPTKKAAEQRGNVPNNGQIRPLFHDLDLPGR